MTLKERIINDFLSNNRRNFTIYGTNAVELGNMYDKLVTSIRSGEQFDRFLSFENAMTSDGKIKFDLTTDYTDKESKKIVKNQKVIFKYPVYKYFNTEYQTAMQDIKEKQAKIPLPIES